MWALGIGLGAALLMACAPAGGGERASGAPAPAAAAAPARPAGAEAPTAATPPPEIKKLVFAVPQVNGTTMAYAIGAQQGFFREEGFEVEIPAMRTELIAAGLLSGEVDYISAFSPAINNALTGVPLRLIATTVSHSTRRLMSVPEVQSIEGLRGKIITVQGFADGPHSAAVLILKHYGLDPQSDVGWLTGGSTVADRLLFMDQGRAHAAIFSGAEIPRAEAMGYVTLVRVDDVVPLPESGVATTLSRIETQRDEVKRVLRAVVRSLRWTKGNREGSIPAYMERLRLSREDAEQAYDGGAWAYSDDGTVSERGLRVGIDVERGHLDIAEDVPFSRVADFGPLYEVLADMGITPTPDAAR
jgi:ABC-type nitrate/sulfonate/bicarbonate transport system substrate-binding protein